MLLGVLFAWNKVGGEQTRVNKIHDQKDSVISLFFWNIFFSWSMFFQDLLKRFNNKQETL